MTEEETKEEETKELKKQINKKRTLTRSTDCQPRRQNQEAESVAIPGERKIEHRGCDLLLEMLHEDL
jgi:hypothetical protein